MNFQQRLILCTLVAAICLSLSGCGRIANIASKCLGKGAQQSLRQATKQGAKHGGDDVLSKSRFWNTPKPKPISPGARSAAAAVMSVAKTGAAKAFSGAVVSTTRCGEKLVRVNENYNLLGAASRVTARIINQRVAENSSRLEEIKLQLANASLSDSKARQLAAECDEINQLNDLMEAKIESLTAELG